MQIIAIKKEVRIMIVGVATAEIGVERFVLRRLGLGLVLGRG